MENEIIFNPHSARYVHDKVLEALKGEKGKLLDIGAGEGELAYKLQKLGFTDISCCDINPSKFKLSGIKCVQADLNESLPFSDDTFDIVTCTEVLEHLKDPFNAIAHISRVLKTGGKAVITTPNIMNWYSRLRFLFNGYFNDYYLEEEFTKDSKLGHIHPFYFPQLKYFLELNNLEIISLDADKCPGISNFNMGKLSKGFIFYLFFHFFMKPKNKVLMEGNTLVLKVLKK